MKRKDAPDVGQRVKIKLANGKQLDGIVKDVMFTKMKIGIHWYRFDDVESCEVVR